MRKKMREQNDSLNPLEDGLNNENGGPHQNTLHLDDNYIEPVEETDDFAEVLELLDFEGPELPPVIDEAYTEEQNEYPAVQSGDAELANAPFDDDVTGAVTSTHSYLMDISNDLFDLKNMDYDIPLVDADGNIIDKNDIDGLSSYLFDSPKKDVKRYEFPCNDSCQPRYDNLLPPVSGMICVLNTEDPEIPTNDDVFLLNLIPSETQTDVFKPLPRINSKSVRDSTGDSKESKRGVKVSKPIIPKVSKFEKCQVSSPIIGSQFRSEMLGDQRVKQEFSSYNGQYRSPQIIPRNNVIIKSENETGGTEIFKNHARSNSTFGNRDMHGTASIEQQEKLPVEMGPTKVIDPISTSKDSLIDEEPLPLQSDDDDEDDGIPSFSDVEAMILEEDSNLDEQQLFLNGIGSFEHLQTFKYETADTQKRIMRLERSANHIAKRDMTSQGAFAILQGLHMKFYVKKPEVLIGRATEDNKVDIDLGSEGQNSKISRRQAIIHMDHKGIFHMKNLSKFPIFVNSMEVTANQSVSLTSSCLIEIKGMNFLFETNEVCIKKYINSIKNKNVVADTTLK
ncbi:uncharacterized protein [Rutidosis leptorrhynchoides]|uniref:uncharacterized protein n=1 Tax=Rutidosis leptorrhynchoides TaxID=125765 RepID=UPI003A99C721